MTMLATIRRRLDSSNAFPWLSLPGGLFFQPSFSNDMLDYPFYQPLQVPRPSVLQFTAVIQCSQPALKGSSALLKLIRNLATTPHLSKVSWRERGREREREREREKGERERERGRERGREREREGESIGECYVYR